MKKIYLLIVFSIASLAVQAQCQTTATVTDVTCYGQINGTATASAIGAEPYNYSWMPGGMKKETVTGLAPGTYTVTVVDARSCISSATVTITQPEPLIVSANSSVASSSRVCDGMAGVSAEGGTGSYNYSWMPGNQKTSGISSLCAGSYTVCVTDANGCEACEPVAINSSVGIEETISEDGIYYYPNPTRGEFELQLALPNSPTKVLITIFDVVGHGVYSESVIATGSYKEKISLQSMPSGIYFIQMIINGRNSTHKIVKED